MKRLLARTIKVIIALALISTGIYGAHLRIIKNFEPVYWDDYYEAWGVVIVSFALLFAVLVVGFLLVRWILERLEDWDKGSTSLSDK